MSYKLDSEIPIEIKLAQNFSFAYNTLVHVFYHLELEDLLKAAQVCRLWQRIANDDVVWYSKIVPACEKHLTAIVDRFGEKIKKIEIDGLARAKVRLITKNLRKLPNLKRIILADCRFRKLEQILEAVNPNVAILQIEQTHRETLESYSLEFVKKFPNLVSFGINPFSSLQYDTVKALTHLKKLEHLSLYDEFNNFPYEIFKELTSLKCLELGGDTTDFLDRSPDYIYSILKNLPSLNKLKLEIHSKCHYDFFRAINNLPNIRELEIHGEIISKYDNTCFIVNMSNLKNLKVLVVNMDPDLRTEYSIFDYAIRNKILFMAVARLKDTLSYLRWTISSYYVKRIKEIWGRNDCILFQRSEFSPRRLKDVSVIRVDTFERRLRRAMRNTQVFVFIQHYSFRYCPKCKHKS